MKEKVEQKLTTVVEETMNLGKDDLWSHPVDLTSRAR